MAFPPFFGCFCPSPGASSPVASSAQLLWSPLLAQQFSACGATEALQVLQRGAGRALEDQTKPREKPWRNH